MPCPDENTIAELFDGLLASTQRQHVEEHVDTCPRCRAVVAALSGAISEPPAEPAEVPATDPAMGPGVVRAPSFLRGDAVGRYAVLECLGAGSMGVVYAAYDPNLDRKVALKLLHGGHDPQERDRPFREAKSMARLTHPNIVGVHDVGLHEDHVFIAMEYIDGTTLTRWLGQSERTTPEILEVFAAAGQGLAAAHDARLVHRDFKPDNVMVGRNGRVCVADFGLAAVGANVSGVISGDGRIDATSIVGTPRYMAPEQSEGGPAEPASDQYSFCVALYAALYRQFPFEGDSPEALAEAKSAGKLRAAPTTSTVPATVRRAIERGLSAEPERRHRGMRALLDALGAGQRPRTKGWAMLTGAIVGAAGVGVVVVGDAEPPCATVGVAAAWDPARRAAVARAIASNDAPYAEQLSLGVVENLDRYAEAWSAMHREACEAARVRGTQSSAVLELRMECLEARRVELGALTDVLQSVDTAAADHAIDATARLTSIADCRDVERLRRRSTRREGQPKPPPERVATLARIKALVDAGNFSDAAPLASSIAEDAERDGDPRSASQALIALSWAQAHVAPGGAPEQTLHRALDQAEAAGADEQRAQAMTLLVFVVGYAQARYVEGARWGRHAAALADRIDAPPRERAQLLRYRGLIHHEQGDFADAEGFHRRAVDTLTAAGLDQHPDFGKCVTALANALRSQRQYVEAQRYFEHALRLELDALGPWHPRVANTTHGLGNVLEEQGQDEAAQEHYRRALEVHEAIYGREHADVASDLLALGNVGAALGDYARSEEMLREALRIHDAVVEGPHPRRAAIVSALGRLRLSLGDAEGSRVFAEEAVALLRQAAPNHPDVAVFEHNLGATLLLLGRFDDALAHFQRSVDTARAVLGEGHAMVGVGLTGVGRAQHGLARYADATESLEAALRLWEDAEPKPRHRFDARVALAAALWEADRERGRARSLARLAIDEYAAEDGPDPDRLASAREWIASRP
ncbi:MAG: serine/threonine-protein kinase [Myxococcota bacterium]